MGIPRFTHTGTCSSAHSLGAAQPLGRKLIVGVELCAPDHAAWIRGKIDRTGRALRLQRMEGSDRENTFASIIRCTADPTKADKRTRSKWSRVMRYAAAYKPDAEPLDQFVRRKGAINECAARFSRCVGRGTATKGVS